MEISFKEVKEAPSVGKESREAFFARLKENIVYCHHAEFVEKTKGESGVCLAGVCSSIETLREEESRRPEAYANPIIYVDDHYYTKRFGQDYTEMLVYDLEHEMWEVYLVVKKGYNPDVIDLRKGKKPPHLERAHQLAIKKALKKAHKEGRLDDYLQWQRTQHRMYQALGDPYALISFVFYQREAKKLEKSFQKEKK